MDWTQTLTIIGTVLVPMLSGFGWVIHRLNDIEQRISFIDQRLSRLEGAFEERGRWESRREGR